MNSWQRIFKRTFDLVVTSLILIVITPLLFLVAVLIRIESKGPILFRQTRVGLNGKPFKIYKFRTMYIHSESENITKHTIQDDPRVTKLGRFLRKTSIDELPAFFSVLEGEMSLVGPRPYLLSHSDFYSKLFNKEYDHSMKPGITGWSQVAYLSRKIPNWDVMEKIIEYDRYYVENWSILFDMKILFLTIMSV
ncbi:MAG: sugar transferase, partial [Nitrososphaeraceae archaeon]